jgi:hypothetical protein
MHLLRLLFGLFPLRLSLLLGMLAVDHSAEQFCQIITFVLRHEEPRLPAAAALFATTSREHRL